MRAERGAQQNGILNSDWYRVGGGDGFYTANDPTDWTILYSESQDGETNRIDLGRGTSTASVRAAGQARTRRRLPAGRGEDAGPRSSSPRSSASAATPNGNIVPDAAARHELPVLLEHPVHPVAAQSADGLSRRRSSVPFVRSRRTWMASPDLTKNIGRNDRPIMGVAGTAPMASKHDGAASYSNIVTIGESPLCPASSGSAPTTATSR